MATSNEKLIEWCQEAREILKASGSKGKGALAFDAALGKVTKALAELTRLAPTAAIVVTLEGRFAAKATAAHVLGERAKTEGAEKLRDDAKRISDDLDQLASDMTKAMPQVKDRARYLALMASCRKRKASLETFPYADVSDVNNVILGAVLGEQALDDAALVTKALSALGGFDKAVKLAEEKQLRGATAAQKDVEAQGKCLERMRVVKELLGRAESGFADKALAKQLSDAISAAQTKMDQKQWVAALALLTAKGLPDGAALEKAEGKTLATLPQALLKQIKDQLATFKALVDDGTYADARDSADEHMREALTFNAKGAEQVLQDTIYSLQNKVSNAQSLKRSADAYATQVGLTLEQAKARMPADVLLILSGELEQLKSEIGQKRLLSADARGAELQRKAGLAQVKANQAWAAWGRISDSFTESVKTLRGHAQVPGATPEARLASATLVLKASDSRKQQLIAMRDWDALATLNTELVQGITAFDEAVKQYAAFAGQRRAANEQWSGELRAMQSTIDSTRNNLEAAGDVDLNLVLGPLGEELAKLERRWADRMANATDETSLGVKAMLDELKLLVAKVAAAGDPVAVKQTAKDQATEKARKQFDEAAAPMTELLRTLEFLDPVAGEAFAERLQALRGDDKTPLAERLGPLRTLVTETRGKVTTREKERPQQSSGMRQRCEKLTVRLELERGKLKSTGDKTFLALFTQLTEELADLKMLAGTSNLEVANANEKRLDEVDRQLRSIESLSGQGSAFKPVRAELERLDSSLEEAESDLRDNVPRSLAALKKAIAQLKTDVLSMAPQAALDEISALRVSLNRARGEANTVKVRRKDFVDLLPVVIEKIDMLGRDGTVPEFVVSLRKRMGDIRAQVKDPTKLDLARKRLDELHHEVEDAIVNPSKALDMQTKLLAEAEKARLFELQCKATLANLRGAGVARARKAVNDKGGDTALIAELERMVSAVDEVMKSKVPDHADAMRRMRLIEQRIGEIERDPYGPGIGSRNALPNDAKLFAESARKLQAALIGFPQVVSTSVEPAPHQSVIDKLSKLVEDLSTRIDADQFVLPAMQLSDAKQPVRQRREQREAALLRVRNTTALLNEHPQFAALWKNPIHVELKALASELDQRLRRLEANIRRAVH